MVIIGREHPEVAQLFQVTWAFLPIGTYSLFDNEAGWISYAAFVDAAAEVMDRFVTDRFVTATWEEDEVYWQDWC